jgi:zinc transport system substrate-binding protein
MSVMNVRRLIPTAAVAGAVSLGLVTLSACSGTSGAAGKESDGKLAVVASFYPMQYLAEQIGGEHVAVNTLTKPGVEPHDLELKPKQIGELGEADYILYLKGIQPAVDEAIKQAGVKNTVDAATLTKLEDHGTAVPATRARPPRSTPPTRAKPTPTKRPPTSTATSPRPAPTRTSGSTR